MGQRVAEMRDIDEEEQGLRSGGVPPLSSQSAEGRDQSLLYLGGALGQAQSSWEAGASRKQDRLVRKGREGNANYI